MKLPIMPHMASATAIENFTVEQRPEMVDNEATELVKPLTNWANPPKLGDLKQDLLEASFVHNRQKGKIQEWLDNLNVEGKAKPKVIAGNSSVQPKLIRKQAEWRYAALSEPFLSTDDLFNVTPTTWEDREAAKQNQLVLNHQINATHFDKVSFIDEYVRTAVDEGTVIIRCGWKFEEEEYTDHKHPVVRYQVDPEIAPMHEYLAQLKEESPSQWLTDVPEELKTAHEMTLESGQPIRPVIVAYESKKKKRVVANHPTGEICDYRNITMDPTAQGDIEKANFVVASFESSLAQLRKDSKYKNLDRINVSANSPLAEPDHSISDGSGNFNFSDEPRKKIVVKEYWGNWDIHGNGMVVPIVVAWVGDTIIRMEENPYPDKKHPFIAVQYLPVRKSNYGEPDGELLIENQKIIGAVTRGMIDIMGKSANAQTGVRKDFLDTTNRRKFDKGQDYEYNANVDPREGVFMHTFPNIPESAPFMINLMNQDAESLTGVKSWTSGVSGQSLGDVAAGIRGALDAASKRELGILRRLSNGIVKMGRKFIAMNQEFMSDIETVRITNEEFVQVRRDDLGGSFDLKLSISTAEEDNNKAEQLAFMFQTIGPNGDRGMTNMILSDIARLRKMPDLAKKIENYQPQPDPVQQQIQQLELMKLQMEIKEIESRIAMNMSGANLAGAKANTEGAKAANIQSDTDQKNLDFVEQESGVTQERAKELHGAQAKSQGELKLLEHELNKENQGAEILKEYVKERTKAEFKQPAQ